MAGIQRLSVCMIVRNEAADLDRCLRSVRGVADEIIVVDTGSTDDTVDVARAHGARVARAAWHGDFAQARNTSLGMATGDWILVLDADEELVDASHPLVREAMARDDADAYWCHILSFTGDAPDEAHVMENIYPRLFRRAAGLRFVGAVHEQLVVSHARAPIEPRPSRIRILHYGYLNPVILRKAKISRNTELIEQALRDNPRQPFQWFNLGAEHLRSGRYAEAEAALRRALEIIGDAQPAYLPTLARNLAVAVRQQGRYDDALRLVADVQARYPDYTDLWYLEGTMRADLLDWTGVERAMRRCLELGEPPAHYLSLRGVGTSLPWIWLGVAARETGRPADAVACLRRAADLVPEEPMALQQLAALVSTLDGYDAAGRALRAAASRGRHAARAAARALAKAGAFAQALEVLPRGRDGLPDDPYGMLFAGECLFRLARYADAMDTLLRIPGHDPLGLPARLDALLCALACGDRDAARTIMTVIRELAPPELGAVVRTYGVLASLATGDDVRDELREADHAAARALLRTALRTFLQQDLVGLASRAASMFRMCGLTDGQAMCEIGKVAYLANRPDLAGPWLATAYAQRGLDYEGCAVAAEICFLANDMPGALALSRAFLDSGRRAALGFYLRAASAALGQRAYRDAVAFLEAARERYPHASVVSAALDSARDLEAALAQAQPAGTSGA